MRAALATAVLPIVACATAPPPATVCWRSLAPPTGDENLGLAMTNPWLASDGSDDVWLTWSAPETRLLRWTRGRWTEIPVPVPPGAKGAYIPVVATGPDGAVVLAALARGKDGTTLLHVARSSGDTWEWLGPPLISSTVPFTHVNDVALALDASGRPVVAWSEEVHVRLGGLFAARWDGTSWKRILDLHPEETNYNLSLAVTVDPADRVWLAWTEGGSTIASRMRVSRLDGSGWTDIGRHELQTLVARLGGVRRPSLALGADGIAWLTWVAWGVHSERSLAIARWNGAAWTQVPPPDLPEGTVSDARMIMKASAPTIAWSQPDASENRHLYLADLVAGDRWRVQFAGFHLAEGVSEVGDINLASGSAGSLYVSWDEAGDDRRRTRLMHAYACPAGEKPIPPPKAVVERDTWPKTVDEAARLIVSKMRPEDMDKVRKTPENDLILFHHGWGTGIRNSLGLWRGNEKLLSSCGKGQPIHPDDCSMQIIEAVWKLLRETPAR